MIHKFFKRNNDIGVIQMRLKLSRGYLSEIGIYETKEGKEYKKDSFYKCLQQILKNTNKYDMVANMSGFNARAGKDNIYTAAGTNRGTTCNRNRKRLNDFVLYSDLKIMNSLLQHKGSRKYIWSARGQKSINDYSMQQKANG
jgi:hypothetical protein